MHERDKTGYDVCAEYPAIREYLEAHPAETLDYGWVEALHKWRIYFAQGSEITRSIFRNELDEGFKYLNDILAKEFRKHDPENNP